jgi:short-subunit dehydrogenase
MDDLRGKVVVVTGASSGLGRETAVQLARRGCSLVLAARRQSELERTARLCEESGGRALVVRTDVTIESDVQGLARAALRRWGRIDVWINNAAVTLFGSLESGAFEEHRRVIETNVFGCMHGARAVLPLFRAQHAGVLINVGSVLSKIGQPFVPSYVVSKFALRGLSEALRMELADEPAIHVCTVFPYAIDTPHFQTGANETGHKAFVMPPMQTPEKVAQVIVELVEHPRRERHVPRSAVLGLGLHWLRPRIVEQLIAHALERWHLQERQPRTEGDLWVPSAEPASVHGRRTPRVTTPRLLAWAALEYVKLETRGLLQHGAFARRAAGQA